jgi:dGTPase
VVHRGLTAPPTRRVARQCLSGLHTVTCRMTDSSYAAALLERHQQGGLDEQTLSGRSPFERDRDRILYSSAFRALAGKTQVVAATELGYTHNRLTHTLKVAQIGRTMASRLARAGARLDPTLVETACLAHDIGHPPFGHAGEMALNAAVEKHRRKALGLSETAAPPEPLDGFEGNAQNLRVLTRLATHRYYQLPGLHLTRATLLAATKYPWKRGFDVKDSEKWGAYHGDVDALGWALEARPDNAVKPIEAELMDWADDVTYAVHDVEDWYRSGLIPLEQLFSFRVPNNHSGASHDENTELARFLDWVLPRWEKKGKTEDRGEIVKLMHVLADNVSVVTPFHGTREAKGLLQATVSDLIGYFCDTVTFEGDGIAYDGVLVIDQDRNLLCDLLKELVWFYVIERPALAAQQHGQARIVMELVDWLHEDPQRLLPEDRKAECTGHGDLTRAVADHIASLTEPMAVKLHGKLSGGDLGAITDRI